MRRNNVYQFLNLTECSNHCSVLMHTLLLAYIYIYIIYMYTYIYIYIYVPIYIYVCKGYVTFGCFSPSQNRTGPNAKSFKLLSFIAVYLRKINIPVK